MMELPTLRRRSHGSAPIIGTALPAAPGAAGGAEHRRAPREETHVPARLRAMDREHDCTIRNVSLRGMTLALDAPALGVGSQVLVSWAGASPCWGTIRWLRGGLLGVELANPLSLDQVHSMRDAAPAAMRPRAGRGRVKLAAVARFADRVRKVEVCNLSVGGLMMASGLVPPPGQRLLIEFPDLAPLASQVRWSGGGRCGVMFAELLPLPAAEELMRRGGLPPGWLDEVRLAHATTLAA